MTEQQQLHAITLLRQCIDWVGLVELTVAEEEKAEAVQVEIERFLDELEEAPRCSVYIHPPARQVGQEERAKDALDAMSDARLVARALSRLRYASVRGQEPGWLSASYATPDTGLMEGG
jgi:hypothetical protein